MSHPIVPAQAVFSCDHPGYHKQLAWLGMINIAPINMVMTWGWCKWQWVYHEKNAKQISGKSIDTEDNSWISGVLELHGTATFPPVEAWPKRHSFVYFSHLTPVIWRCPYFFQSQGIQVLDRDLPSGKRLQKTIENHHFVAGKINHKWAIFHSFMGKSTLSMAIFKFANC